MDTDIDEGKQFVSNRVTVLSLDEEATQLALSRTCLLVRGDPYNSRLVERFLRNQPLPGDGSTWAALELSN